MCRIIAIEGYEAAMCQQQPQLLVDIFLHHGGLIVASLVDQLRVVTTRTVARWKLRQYVECRDAMGPMDESSSQTYYVLYPSHFASNSMLNHP
jgi:hypothetical protein